MAAAPQPIPFESQADQSGNRTCGAACLSMVYRSFGKEVPQAEIWPAIVKQNSLGSMASTTHLMAKDAWNRGFAAVAILARHPLQALRLCRESGIRAILNHRLSSDSRAGHYAVLVNLDKDSVTLHDPYWGPQRRLSHRELLELWQPVLAGSEIVGNVLIGIAEPASAASSCWLCHVTIPPSVECPRCRRPVGLQPSALLGCMNTACIARTWDYICCPACDYTWTFSLQAGQTDADAAGPKSPPAGVESTEGKDAGAEAAPWMLPLFGALDQFCAHIRGLPGVEAHPEVMQYLEQIGGTKEKISLAHSEQLVYQKMGREQLDKMRQASERMKAELRQKLTELNTPLPALDGDALGRAMLKNLGFV